MHTRGGQWPWKKLDSCAPLRPLEHASWARRADRCARVRAVSLRYTRGSLTRRAAHQPSLNGLCRLPEWRQRRHGQATLLGQYRLPALTTHVAHMHRARRSMLPVLPSLPSARGAHGAVGRRQPGRAAPVRSARRQEIEA